MILLRLSKSFYGREDTGLTDKLLAELPGILKWAVAGWHRLNQRGRFVQPTAADEMLAALHDLSSPIGEFVRTCCVVGPALRIPRADLYGAYTQWADGKGRKNIEDSAGFGRLLRAAVPALWDSQPRVAGEKTRCYEGIDLAPVEQVGT